MSACPEYVAVKFDSVQERADADKLIGQMRQMTKMLREGGSSPGFLAAADRAIEKVEDSILTQDFRLGAFRDTYGEPPVGSTMFRLVNDARKVRADVHGALADLKAARKARRPKR